MQLTSSFRSVESLFVLSVYKFTRCLSIFLENFPHFHSTSILVTAIFPLNIPAIEFARFYMHVQRARYAILYFCILWLEFNQNCMVFFLLCFVFLFHLLCMTTYFTRYNHSMIYDNNQCTPKKSFDFFLHFGIFHFFFSKFSRICFFSCKLSSLAIDQYGSSVQRINEIICSVVVGTDFRFSAFWKKNLQNLQNHNHSFPRVRMWCVWSFTQMAYQITYKMKTIARK